MKSPFTGIEMQLVKEKEVLSYRKDKFEVYYYSFECDKTKERFTNDELDLRNINQVHNLYREKYGIPFPEEIKNIREKYEVSAKKMSEILGLGSNAYRLYESGEIPSVSIGRLILSIKEPEEFRRQIEFSSNLLKDTEKSKLLKIVDKLIDDERNVLKKIMEVQSSFQSVDDYTGFKMFDFEKVAHVLCYFSIAKFDLFKTKVNKLLFYSDFLNYQRQGTSMLGIAYRAIPYGPVPAEYEKIYKELYEQDFINIEQIPELNYAERLLPTISFNSDLFSESELKVLEDVAIKFKNINTVDIVNISHKEIAWLDNKDNRNIISYKKYAYNLQAFE